MYKTRRKISSLLIPNLFIYRSGGLIINLSQTGILHIRIWDFVLTFVLNFISEDLRRRERFFRRLISSPILSTVD